MQNYLSELLTEDQQESDLPIISVKAKYQQPLEKLLQKVDITERIADPIDEPVYTVKSSVKNERPKIVEEKIQDKVEEKTQLTLDEPLKTRKSDQPLIVHQSKNYRKGSFQAMFFNVAGLTIAVPLIELGGIHNEDKTTSLMGKPKWFTGVMLHRDEKINVVNTALWVMPEKCDEALINSLNYQYIVMLGNSHWGLSAETLVDTVTLEQEDVKWLDLPNKRPWLAGLVKERMCALLDVESLIKLLDAGANINQD
ncbi:chemotaxis protein CheW [Colwellia sp. BRX8-3]|nr:chemotaxis protein CheW [Colwellia sp. BRX8-9]MBA6350922.1 chemotaxis protein CheW [Colwellia sp. BRX9-1]MBA6354538.1 chemotaxis protein CheW [Colwellia sp. BRX8-3]MBA6358195.1 chemotaxis protein CheW [Colwellia sp. BRX8-6]MBA6366052.1 chemotaxis protein CheW [Colwellia sp. BRX8-5]MBA6374440.1 chemotaxis protein CheW [Colwellia sp. BRX8-2]MBA6382215.1 chemotaxis protein CheW [Colwellia sp. BRX10-9]MBA6394253.1 chemotaxis protein CheW [Colwellia sp. BRX10-6]